MLCPSCNKEVPAAASFCANCGTPISATATPGGAATAAVPARAPSSGLSDNAAGAIAYITIIPAIVFLVMEPYNRSRFVRFHSFQSIGLCIAWIALEVILGFIPVVGWVLAPFVGLAMLIVWLVCLLKASKGEKFKLPLVGDLAEKQAESM